MSTPSRYQSPRRLGVDLGVLGGGLGVVAGLTQALVGSRIPHWSGDKSNSLGLGLLTVALSLLALASALILRAMHAPAPGRSAACVAALVVPAGLCFSTVGRLWWLPGILLLVAVAVITAAGDAAGMAVAVRAHRSQILISVLGAYLLLVAVSAAPTGILLLGTTGGAVLTAAPWLPIRSVWRLALILLATVPFAVLTWASLATPLIAVLAVALWFTGRSSFTPTPKLHAAGMRAGA